MQNRKKFIFCLESLPAFCIVSHFLVLVLDDNAFKYDFNFIKKVFSLKVLTNWDVLHLKWKKDKEKQLIFWDTEKTLDSIRVSNSKALPYIKYHNHFVHLGYLAGFKYLLKLYQLRWVSGRNINSKTLILHISRYTSQLSTFTNNWESQVLLPQKNEIRLWVINMAAHANYITCLISLSVIFSLFILGLLHKISLSSRSWEWVYRKTGRHLQSSVKIKNLRSRTTQSLWSFARNENDARTRYIINGTVVLRKPKKQNCMIDIKVLSVRSIAY